VYGWCAHERVARVAAWGDVTKRSGVVDWVFESGCKGIGQIVEMFAECRQEPKLGVGAFSHDTKRLVPLQSADLVAYEMHSRCS